MNHFLSKLQQAWSQRVEVRADLTNHYKESYAELPKSYFGNRKTYLLLALESFGDQIRRNEYQLEPCIFTSHLEPPGTRALTSKRHNEGLFATVIHDL